MLRTDFNGYKEFEKKLMNAKGIELFKLSTERTRVWVNELQEIVGFIPAGDIVFCHSCIKHSRRRNKERISRSSTNSRSTVKRIKIYD